MQLDIDERIEEIANRFNKQGERPKPLPLPPIISLNQLLLFYNSQYPYASLRIFTPQEIHSR